MSLSASNPSLTFGPNSPFGLISATVTLIVRSLSDGGTVKVMHSPSVRDKISIEFPFKNVVRVAARFLRFQTVSPVTAM
jgi:hypothetical protein